MKTKVLFLAILLSTFVHETSFAQDKGDSGWNYLTEVYLMFPNMSGEVGIANLPPAEVNADASKIFGNLKMGAMLYLEAYNDDWAISSDLLYMKLGQELKPNQLITSGELIMKQTAWEVDGLRRITNWFEAGIGGRLVSLSTELDLQTINNPRNESASKTWFDPVVVFRTQGVLNEKWLLQFRGDFGGFGVGSDFSWQAQANVGYRFSKLFQTSLGYRYISIDYDKGVNAERFLYNIDTYGFVLRLGFNF